MNKYRKFIHTYQKNIFLMTHVIVKVHASLGVWDTADRYSIFILLSTPQKLSTCSFTPNYEICWVISAHPG